MSLMFPVLCWKAGVVCYYRLLFRYAAQVFFPNNEFTHHLLLTLVPYELLSVLILIEKYIQEILKYKLWIRCLCRSLKSSNCTKLAYFFLHLFYVFLLKIRVNYYYNYKSFIALATEINFIMKLYFCIGMIPPSYPTPIHYKQPHTGKSQLKSKKKFFIRSKMLGLLEFQLFFSISLIVFVVYCDRIYKSIQCAVGKKSTQ